MKDNTTKQALDQIKELEDFRPKGSTFWLSGIELTVINHYDELYAPIFYYESFPSTIPSVAKIPRIKASYKNIFGELKYEYFSYDMLPVLIEYNKPY